MNKTTVFTISNVPNIFGGKSSTTRVTLPINCTGNGMEIRFSNLFGKKAGVIDHVMVAKCSKSGVVNQKTALDVTFKGEKRFCIMVGETVVSDRISLKADIGEYVAISIFCKEKPESVGRLGTFVNKVYGKDDNCQGNFFGVPKLASEKLIELQTKVAMSPMIPYLRAIDFFTQVEPIVLSCLGDSLTEHCKWYAPLLESLYEMFSGKICILNHGIGGNRLLPRNEEDKNWMKSCGAAGVERVDWDSLADYGVTHLLFALGVNDMGMGTVDKKGQFNPTLEDFRRGCRKIVEKAHNQNIKVIAFTVFPARANKKYPAEAEAARLKWNQMIREENIFDAVIDVETVLKDPKKDGYRDGYVISDGVHLNETGGRILADLIKKEIQKEILHQE